MSWINEVVFTASMIFMAEFADKTMIATTSLALASRKLLPVVLISTIAFMSANLVPIGVAMFMRSTVPYELLRVISAILFILFGLMYLLVAEKNEHKIVYRGLWTVFVLVFMSELGDKTQLSIVAIALKSKCIMAVLLGAIIGYFALNIFAASILLKIIKVNVVKISRIVGILFIVIGILILAGVF